MMEMFTVTVWRCERSASSAASRVTSGLLVIYPDVQAALEGQPLQHGARDLVIALGGLVGICGGADDNAATCLHTRFAEARERLVQRGQHGLTPFDEDAGLEGPATADHRCLPPLPCPASRARSVA